MADHHKMSVLSSDLAVEDVEQIHKRFLTFTRRMRQRLTAPEDAKAVSFKEDRIINDLAKKCRERRLREVGLSRLQKHEQQGIFTLARHGGRLLGPVTLDEVDILAARLHKESPWMSEVSTFVMHHMRSFVRSGGVGFHLPPILLAGPPGIGKSWFARSIAEAAGLPFRLIDVGGGTAAFRIAGTEKGWSSAQPGRPVETMLETYVANPVMIVDEIDKAGAILSDKGTSSSLTAALLGLLDPGTAPKFECVGTRVRFDMSRVIWVLTANDVDRIPAPLRDRCRVFHMPNVTPDMSLAFFDRLARDVCDADGLKAEARAFVARQARSGRISLRQIARLVETLRSSDDGEPVH
ncbi:AAA family ATPase [Roseovarius nanhaiticus]|uniref:AAA family ATPase n=1 Tax=Roseovarius nanhaiticus TaxID=573024 RepID=UPI0024912A03|nr:AAA family ATPase [Roseovarius nanhaiticus]